MSGVFDPAVSHSLTLLSTSLGRDGEIVFNIFNASCIPIYVLKDLRYSNRFHNYVEILYND